MIFDPVIINELYYSSSEDEDYPDSDSSCGSEDDLDNDDDEKKEVNRSKNAYYFHNDRLDSHIYKTYLSHKAEIQGVHDRDSHVGRKFRQKNCVPYSTIITGPRIMWPHFTLRNGKQKPRCFDLKVSMYSRMKLN